MSEPEGVVADIVCYQTLQKPGPVMASDFKNMSIARIGHLSFRSFGHQRQSDICLDPCICVLCGLLSSRCLF